MRCSHLRRCGSWLRGCHASRAVDGQILERGVLHLRPLRARDHRLGELLVVEQVAKALLLGIQERIDLRHVLDVDAGGADQRERGETACIAHRELGGDPAAQGASDQVDPAQVELVEELEIEIRQVGDGVEPFGRIGLAEAGMLGGDHVELLRQPRHAGKPNPHAASAMQEQHRRAGTAAHEPDAARRRSISSRLNDRPFRRRYVC